MNAFAIVAAASIFACGGALAADEGMSKDDYKASGARIDQEYDANKTKCDSFSGNAKDVCRAEAKARQRVARAELDARYKPGIRADYRVAEARADGAYEVAREKCDDLSGNPKDVCAKEAKAARTKAVADAKVARQNAQAGEKTERVPSAVSGTPRKAEERAAEVKEEGAQDVDEARIKVAREKCDRFSGDAKEQCLEGIKKRPGRPVTEVR